MRTCISIVFLFLGVGSLHAQKNFTTAEIKTHIYCSHCTHCETCGQLFEKEMYTLKGVKNFTVHPETNSFTVIYNPKKITIEAIRNKIASCGYDADEVLALPEAVGKLDECCRKTN